MVLVLGAMKGDRPRGLGSDEAAPCPYVPPFASAVADSPAFAPSPVDVLLVQDPMDGSAPPVTAALNFETMELRCVNVVCTIIRGGSVIPGNPAAETRDFSVNAVPYGSSIVSHRFVLRILSRRNGILLATLMAVRLTLSKYDRGGADSMSPASLLLDANSLCCLRRRQK